MGSSLSIKKGSIMPVAVRPSQISKRNTSWTETIHTEDIETSEKLRNFSVDNILNFRSSKKNRGDIRKHPMLTSQGSSESSSFSDVAEKAFVHKVQNYLQSIEKLGEISDLNCFFGKMMLRTEEGNFSVEVKGTGMGGEPIVTLESEPNPSNAFMIYQYSTHFMNSRYTYFSLLYITNVERSDSTYYVLQANTNNPSGVPNLIPRRIKSSDNPKLVSPSSRFVGTFEEGGPKSTLIVFMTKDMEPFYLAQSDLSLDFTRDHFRAGIFDFNLQTNILN